MWLRVGLCPPSPGPTSALPPGADLFSALEMPLASFWKLSPTLLLASPSQGRGSPQPCSCGLTSALALQEEWLLLKTWSCGSRPFPRTRDLRQLQVSGESQAQPCPHLAPLLWLLSCCLHLLFTCPVFVLPSSPDLFSPLPTLAFPLPSALTFAFTGPSQSSWPVLSQVALTCLCPLRRCGSALWPWRLSWP